MISTKDGVRIAGVRRRLLCRGRPKSADPEYAIAHPGVVNALLSELVEQGLDFSTPRLYILDGKALHAIFGSRLWKEVVLGRAHREMLGPDLWRQLEERDPERFARNNRKRSESVEILPAAEVAVHPSTGD